MATSQTTGTTPQTRRTVASYREYADAERAVDWLPDQGFAVERVAIVGRGLRSVEQVASRMSTGRAALISGTSIVADRYELQVDQGVAEEEAQRLLDAMPGGR